MRSLKNKKLATSYILSKPFGNYYIPARFQYLILRDYFKKKKFIFSLPQGEPVFTKTRIRLRDIVSDLKPKSDFVILSIFVLPKDNIIRKKIINKLIEKKITTHFIFENRLAKNKNHYKEISNLLKLNKFIKN